MLQLILASQNAHKAEEFAAAIHSIRISSAPEPLDVEENADTFRGNAQIKARAYAKAFECNALADDSGLCVDALHGNPGVHSQRFALIPPDVDNDPDRTAANNRKLLKALHDVPESQRTAHFSCALCLVIVEPGDIEFCKELSKKHREITFYDHAGLEVSADYPGIVHAEIAVEGQANGRILRVSAGNGGFGYDPLFYCPETGCTFAELSKEQKLSVSHRGRAIAALQRILGN